MFPKTTDSLPSADNADAEVSGISLKFDFNIGDFILVDGRIQECTGTDALKVWIEKALRTEKGRHEVYEDTEYGVVLEDLLVGNNFPAEFVQSELRREIEDSLLQNPQIIGLSSFSVEREENYINVSFSVVTRDNGTFTQEVALNV